MTLGQVNQNSRIIKNTLFMYLRMFLTMAIGFYSSRLTLQILGVSDFGLYNLVGGFIALFSFLNKSMGTAVQRFISVNAADVNTATTKKVISTSIIIHICIGFVTLSLIELFYFIFFESLNIPSDRVLAAKVVFQVAALSMVVNIVNVPYSAFLRAREEFSAIAKIEVLQSVLNLLGLILLSSLKIDKLIVYSILIFLLNFIFTTTIRMIAIRSEDAKFQFFIDTTLIKEMLNFSGVFFLTTLVRISRDKGIVILINLFLGLTVNAAYAIAEQIRLIVETFSSNFRSTVVPQLMSSYASDNKNRMFRLIYTSTKITNYLLFFIALPIMFEADFLLKNWLKTPPKETSILVTMLLLNVIIESYSFFLVQVIHSTGKIKKFSLAQVMIYFSGLILVYLSFMVGNKIVFSLGILVVSSLCLLFLAIYFAKKLVGLDVNYFVFSLMFKNLIILLVTCAILLALQIAMDDSLIRFIFTSLITITTVSLLGFFLGLNSEEQHQISSIFIKSKSKFRLFK